MVNRKAVENTQVKDNEVERLIKKSIREMRRKTDIKDKDRLRAEEVPRPPESQVFFCYPKAV